MRRRGKRVDDLDAFVGCRVGLVDDTERRLAAAHQRQGLAHIAGGRELTIDYYEQRTYEEWADSSFAARGNWLRIR